MDKHIIQFHISDFNRLDHFFETYFSKDISPFETYIRRRYAPKSITEPYLEDPQSHIAPWDIYLYETQIIGEITYRPGQQMDTLFFDFDPGSINFVQQLINNIVFLMDKNGFSIIYEKTDLMQAQGLTQDIPKSSSPMSLSPGEMVEDNELINEGEEPVISQQPKTEEDIENLLTDIKLMKNFYKYYNPKTAKSILKAIPIARNHSQRFGIRWGPGIISNYCPPTSTTVGRYLKAFCLIGLTEIEGDGEMIEIPYTPKSTSNSSNSQSKK